MELSSNGTEIMAEKADIREESDAPFLKKGKKEDCNMKMRKIILTLMLGSILLMGCGSNTMTERQTRPVESTLEENTSQDTQAVENTEEDDVSEESEAGTKVLIAYFTRSDNITVDPDVDAISSASINLDGSESEGNLAIMADYIKEVTGGDTFSILTTELYPTEYRDTTDVAKEEQNDDARPELANHVDNFEYYDVIYLGYPNWWGGLPMPVYTFLEEYDFTGKTIIPFASHEGSGLGSGPSEIESLCPDATVLDGFAVRGSAVSDGKTDIESWIDGLNLE